MAANKEIETDIDLDGLISCNERVIDIQSATPYQKIRKSFDFPSLRNRGVYVIELIGNGISSRALIRKGKLSYIDTIVPNGYQFRVFNDQTVFLPPPPHCILILSINVVFANAGKAL